MNIFFAKIRDLIQYRYYYLWILWGKLFPESEPKYIQEVMEAAELEECDPSEIMWCIECGEWHKESY